MRTLGADPGIGGGLAIVEFDDGAVPQIVDAIDIPVAGVGAKERVDVLVIRAWLETHRPQHALIERTQAMPKQGASSGFKYGRSVGSLEATIACCGIPLTIIEPTAWKKFHHSAAAKRNRVAYAQSNCFRLRTLCLRAGKITRKPKRR